MRTVIKFITLNVKSNDNVKSDRPNGRGFPVDRFLFLIPMIERIEFVAAVATEFALVEISASKASRLAVAKLIMRNERQCGTCDMRNVRGLKFAGESVTERD